MPSSSGGNSSKPEGRSSRVIVGMDNSGSGVGVNVGVTVCVWVGEGVRVGVDVDVEVGVGVAMNCEATAQPRVLMIIRIVTTAGTFRAFVFIFPPILPV
jgi:hypothetical protein